MAAVAVADILLAACGSEQGSSRPASTYRVSAGLDDCGRGWVRPTGGRQDFTIHNTTVAGEEVYLEDARSRAIFLDIENLGSDAQVRSSVTLDDGTYRFVCLPADGEPVSGSAVTISGSGDVDGVTPSVLPVTRNDLLPALKSYQSWVGSRIPVLQRQVERIRTELASADLTAARSAWLTAHRTYERLGAAYGAFGDLDTDINGLPAPGAAALTDADLEGFHRIEAMLWSGEQPAAIMPYAVRLVDAVTDLGTAFRRARIEPVDIGLRAHEILENALQVELTGRSDAGSHTALATIDANLDGTRQALDPLAQILRSRDPSFARTEQAIDDTQRLVRTFRRSDGAWKPLTSLSRSQREQIDARIGATLELLAPVAAITDPRKDS